MKAIKNPVEIENIRKAQIKDSVAHVRFMKWLKENVGKMRITEMSASDKLDEFRAEMGKFIRPSFEPISSFGEHGADRTLHIFTGDRCRVKRRTVILNGYRSWIL